MGTEQKTIVISDVHISNGAEYSWFQQSNRRDLSAMLTKIADDPSVAELVLLGDLFDLWLYPVDVVPWTVSQIIQANPSVRDALQRCVKQLPDVYYMNGNHDMAVVPGDLDPFAGGGKRIQVVTPDWYNQKYDGERHLQHGHEIDMFNAPPEDGTDPIDGFPLGYFMTRLSVKAPRTVWLNLQDMLSQRHGELHLNGSPMESAIDSTGEWLVTAIIDTLAAASGVEGSTLIRILEPALDGKYTVDDIKKNYHGLYGKWYEKYGYSRILDTMLASRRFVGLDWYANELLSKPNPPKLVVMGHTHRSLKHGTYSNDGCFCGSHALNYVKIIENDAEVKFWTTTGGSL
ncbi:MAG: metallophosphoesterase [Desulfomonilaceae bacterium]